MNPILFASTETKFDTNGLGVLSDAISCIVTEERNGSFELTMQYSVEGIHYADIADRSIILAKPSPTDNPQPFRVYRHTKPLNGIVTFYARHISYDLSGTPVGPFTATNVIDALNKLKTNAVIPCPFEFWTDKVTSASMNVRVPSDIFALLGGQQGSVLDVYGGEYKFDGYTVRLYNERGTDRGVSIRYGKNLLDLEQEKNCANVCTGVYPYWVDSNGENLVQLPEKIVNAPGTYDFTRIKMLDLSSEWQEAPSTDQLQARAETYIKENNIGVPTISLAVSHAMLENTEEYKGQALLERIDLCDTARIEFHKLGVSASAKAVKTEFNALLDRYESITFGDARYTLADSTVEQKRTVADESKRASGLVSDAMKKLNEIVQNSSGLYTTEEIQSDRSVIYYYHDKPALNKSKNVIKFTADAIGLSTDGGKTYPFGFTVTGDMVANILSAIGVNANWINAGILQSLPDENGERNFTFNLQSGDASVRNLSIHGQSVDDIADEKADNALESAKGYADSAVNNFASSVYDPRIAELQKQLDGQIESYFYDYEPKLDNIPASDWVTDDDKKKHEGDLFYWKSKGYAYRFFRDGETWKWQLVRDTDVTKALEEAANAQHTADGKSRTFIVEPVTPYDEGDQWYRGDNSTLVCTNSRQSGAFDMNDWEKLDNYADGKETIYSVQSQYYLSSSSASLKDGEWSNTQPTWTQGKFIWSRQYVTYGDGHHAYTPSETGVCITGNTGASGANGKDGRGVLSWVVEYQASASGTAVPGGNWSGTVPPVPAGRYLWTRTVITYTDNDSTTLYTVSRIGADGSPGTNGTSAYTHIRYSANADGSNFVVEPSPNTAYIGIYTGPSQTAPESNTAYTWSKYMGDNGTNGKDGNGIRSITYYYAATPDQTQPDASAVTGTTIPTLSETNKYLWQKEVIDFTDTAVADKTSVILLAVYGDKGKDGANGTNGTSVTITSTAITYQASDSGTTVPSGDWSDAVPPVSNGQYLWTKTVVTYSDGTSTTAYSVAYKGTDGADGKDGTNGVGIQSITNYYLAYASAAGVTVDTEGWSTSVQSVSAEKKYLWNYEVTAYTDGSSTTVAPHVVGTYGRDGVNGEAGRSISGITEHYLATAAASGVTTGTPGWTETLQQTDTEKRYLWNYETITYTDGSSSTVAPRIIGTHGATGDAGAPGKDGTPGEPGKDGENGIGIEKVEAEYILAPSDTEAPDDASPLWSKDVPAIPDGQYLWTRQKITYTDGTVAYAGKYCMSKAMGDIAQQVVDAQTDMDILNKLTDNGRRKGIFIQDDELYVSASAILTGVLDAARIAIAGVYGSILQGEGATVVNGVTIPTTGLLAMGPKGLLGPLLMLSEIGARLSAKDGGTSLYVTDGFVTTQNGVMRVEDAIAMALAGTTNYHQILRMMTGEPDYVEIGSDGLNTLITAKDRIRLSAPHVLLDGDATEEMYSGSLSTGTITWQDTHSIYVIVGRPNAAGSRTAVTIPSAVISSSRVSYQMADDGGYKSFYLSKSNGTVTLTVNSGVGVITDVYGL